MPEKDSTVDAKLGHDVFKLDQEPHIVIDNEKCRLLCTLRRLSDRCARPTSTSSTTRAT